jgi:putative transposase
VAVRFVRIGSPKTILERTTTAVKRTYHIVEREAETAVATVQEFAKPNGQILLPLMELVTQARVAIDEVIDRIGRQTIETILSLSAEQVAGSRTPGKSSGAVRWHGSQKGRVSLADRQLKVKRPRLRHKQDGEVSVPAYESWQDNDATAQRMMGALLRGVSTREYAEVLPEMAETAGVSRSAVSRAAIEASEAEVEALLNRRFDELKLLVIYIDGLIFGDYTMIGAVGVDVEGNKHVLGIREGATENSTVITALLEDIVARGVDPQRKMLFVIDGSKALRAAINAVFGAHQPVQRCRAHKLRNVLDYLPKEDRPQVKSVLRAAWKLPPKEGMARIKKLAAWLDQKYPSAVGSLVEGLEECFTINRLDVPPSLCRCLATTNIIESPHAGVRIQTRRVTHWQNGNMVRRWMASAFLRTEKRFNKIMGYRDLWTLEAILNPTQAASAKVAA